MCVTLSRIFQCVGFKARYGGDTYEDAEVPMVGKISTALAAILLLGSVGFASARTAQHYDGASYSHHNEMFCNVPSEPCDNEHSVTN
jgi:hypothetical protein